MFYRYLFATGGLLAAVMIAAPGCPEDCTDEDGDTYCAEDGDCNDSDPTVHEGATEVCDGKDNNCNGEADEGFADQDGDGFSSCAGDCNDTDPSIHPNAAETCNGMDEDCDGTADDGFDQDADGYTVCKGDCNDADSSVHPNAAEACNGKDDNCDGTVPANEQDADKDGQSTCAGDCNDADATVNSSATEICDGKDNDCNGLLSPSELDSDKDGFSECKGDCDDADGSSYPGGTETCDGKDNNCDGLSDANVGTSNAWVRSVCGAVISASTTLDAGGNDQASILYNSKLGKFQAWYRMLESTAGTAPNRIGYAESVNGSTWVKASTPVFEPRFGVTDAFDNIRVGFPSVLLLNDTYHMWYQGQSLTGTSSFSALLIGYATSPDGKTWTRMNGGKPVLDKDLTTGAWDSKAVQAPSVLFDATKGKFRMWYSGNDGTSFRTGLAESADGVIWTKNPTYVLNVGAAGQFDSWRAMFARVHQYNGQYEMWYSGDDTTKTFTYEVGLATSPDGVNWTKNATNPILSFGATGSFDSFMVHSAEVIPVSDGFSMFYSGGASSPGPFAIGLARNTAPTARMISPEEESLFIRGDKLDFALEVEDTGDLDTLTTLWYSNQDGFLGHSTADFEGWVEFATTALSSGEHVITAMVFDSGGLTTSTSVSLSVD